MTSMSCRSWSIGATLRAWPKLLLASARAPSLMSGFLDWHINTTISVIWMPPLMAGCCGRLNSMDDGSYHELLRLHRGAALGAYLLCTECSKPWPCPTVELARKLNSLNRSLLYSGQYT